MVTSRRRSPSTREKRSSTTTTSTTPSLPPTNNNMLIIKPKITFVKKTLPETTTPTTPISTSSPISHHHHHHSFTPIDRNRLSLINGNAHESNSHYDSENEKNENENNDTINEQQNVDIRKNIARRSGTPISQFTNNHHHHHHLTATDRTNSSSKNVRSTTTTTNNQKTSSSMLIITQQQPTLSITRKKNTAHLGSSPLSSSVVNTSQNSQIEYGGVITDSEEEEEESDDDDDNDEQEEYDDDDSEDDDGENYADNDIHIGTRVGKKRPTSSQLENSNSSSSSSVESAQQRHQSVNLAKRTLDSSLSSSNSNNNANAKIVRSINMIRRHATIEHTKDKNIHGSRSNEDERKMENDVSSARKRTRPASSTSSPVVAFSPKPMIQSSIPTTPKRISMASQQTPSSVVQQQQATPSHVGAKATGDIASTVPKITRATSISYSASNQAKLIASSSQIRMQSPIRFERTNRTPQEKASDTRVVERHEPSIPAKRGSTSKNNKRARQTNTKSSSKKSTKKRRRGSDEESSSSSEEEDSDLDVAITQPKQTRPNLRTQTRMSRSALTELEQEIDDAAQEMIDQMLDMIARKRKASTSSKSDNHARSASMTNSEELGHPNSLNNNIFVAKWPNRDICILSAASIEDARTRLDQDVETSGAVLVPFTKDFYLTFKQKESLYEDASSSKCIKPATNNEPLSDYLYYLLDCVVEGDSYSDMELHIKGKKFKVHKVVISQYSYFTEKNLRSTNKLSLDTLGFTPAIIRIILIQMYTMESVSLPEINSVHKFQMLKSLLSAADTFGLEKFKVSVEKAIAEQLDLCSLEQDVSNVVYHTNPLNRSSGKIPRSMRIQFFVDTANFAVRHVAHKLLRYLLSNMHRHCDHNELAAAQLSPALFDKLKHWTDSDSYVWVDNLMNRSFTNAYEIKHTPLSISSCMSIERTIYPLSTAVRTKKDAVESAARLDRLKRTILHEDFEATTSHNKARDQHIEQNCEVNQYAPLLLHLVDEQQ